MSDQVGLSSSSLNSIQNLQRIDRSQGINQNELSTGRQDSRRNIIAELASKSLTDRASDLATVKNDINEGLSTVESALGGLDSIEAALNQAKAIASEYEKTSDPTRQADLQKQFNEISQQIDYLAQDSGYNGVNLISSNPDDLTVAYGGEDGSNLTIKGQGADSASLNLSLSVDSVDAAINQVRSSAETLGQTSSILSIRADFTEKLQNNLEAGASDLVETDLNKNAAEALALQTRDQLATAGLNIAAQSERAVVQLF
ncbi:flagellin [Rhodospirillum sp. A1_3_36]|uniref:flagellin n=1 Tax=Rhodospirillum sp. A1_3_36 TaxID=3391666 RepID=UPI0039A49CA4